ncbi:YfbU family protein [Clavibacter zhangzhiyongii]|uniref:YfbU family protein n=1 Tax=Clavibacter zhangzhiyongii TaxID=2768071 RepID=UPI00195B7768|nr:YfbU family protein [Clavibacter zhangzhiyongii]MBM7025308.1 YfbU family protein [Clavibacter zhangzhiyongii]
MPTITVRVTDTARSALESKARENHVTVSDFVRQVLDDAIATQPVGEASSSPRVPDTLSQHDRHTLALLHRILARVLPDGSNDVDGDADYQLQRAHVLERGYALEYGAEFEGIDAELSRRQCRYVVDVLGMFDIAQASLKQLTKAGGSPDEDLVSELQFGGFDHNDDVELHMAQYVEYLVSIGRWQTLRPALQRCDNGNSHSPQLAVYSRMLSAYRQMNESRRSLTSRGSYLLSEDELRQLADAAKHQPAR